jgi:creatinine amidohydrolase
MYIANLTKETFREASKTIDTVIIPIGSLEAHGSHCPLSTDIIVPEKILSFVEQHYGQRIFIAPTVNYGYTPHLLIFQEQFT